MRTLRRPRVSPALVISIVALVMATGGTSLASAPVAFIAKALGLNGKQRKQVKSIARNEIKSEAPGLSVLSATTAGNATNATNASHAANADHATAADTAKALALVAYRANTSAGAVTVPACSTNPCTPDNVGTTFAIATCPAGTVPIGGGGVTADPGVELAGSFPTVVGGGSTPNAWEVDVDNYLQSTSSVEYYVVCTRATAVE